jgi:23S rRNA pseudouridine2605 synthase
MAYKKSAENSRKNVSRQTFKSKDKSSKSYLKKKYNNKSNDEDADYQKKKARNYDSKKRNFNAEDERPKRTYKRSDDKVFKRRNDDENTSKKRRFNNEDERPKRTYKRSDDGVFKRRNDDENTSKRRRFNNEDERPKRTYRRNDDRVFKRRNDDENTSKRRRFNNEDERLKRTYKRNNESESTDKFLQKELQHKNYVRISEPVDSRVRRQLKEKKANAVETANVFEDVKVRLNKFIANSGICSRREADTFIKAGVVSVNGIVVTELGVKVSPSDEILFNGGRLHGEKKVYLLMNKPKNFVTTVEDPHADKTVMTIVRNYCTERVYPVGRLDKNTTGVLLFTNDGELTKVLTHPSYGKKKIYAAGLDKNLTKNDMTRLADGIQLEDGIAFFDEISYTDDDDKRKIGIEIHSGRNRIVRRMFEHFGYKVTKLDRVYFAGFTKAKLKRGECRFLTEQEIAALKMGAYE